MKFSITVISILLASVMVFNCDMQDGCGPDDATHPLPNYSLAALKKVNSWDAVEQKIKYNYMREMDRRADQNLETALENFSNGCPDPDSNAGCDAVGGGNPPVYADPSIDSGDNPSANDYSETNTQVPGVDEADFVKNDGSYIYIIADNQFKIVDAWPPENAAIQSTMPVEGIAKKLYVYNDKALIYSSVANPESGNARLKVECTYGYDCEFTGDGLMLKITVFDITDKTAPKLERETLFSGSYLNSRRIGNVVHTAVIFEEFAVRGLVYWPAEVPYCPHDTDLSKKDIIAAFTKMKAENAKRIMAADINVPPTIKDTRYIDGSPVTTENTVEFSGCLYLSQSPEGKSLLSLASQEIDALEPLYMTTIMGKPGAIYANKDSLYIAARQYKYNFDTWYFEDSAQITEATTIQKFKLSSGTETTYAGSGVAKGRVLNQFSMDAFNGYLRIATTTGHVAAGRSDAHSTLLTLKEDAGKLVVAGMVDHIAPSEDIRSARFSGDTAFIVTFKKTDPLFVFDLSNPEKPEVCGELKIPGFSTYIHLMDENHLLTIGYDAEDNVQNAYFQGIMLQIFDVAQMSDPKLIHKEVIGTRGSTSEAATNHLAFNYFAPKNLLALPMVVCEEGNPEENGEMWEYGDLMTFSGLMVYKVTTEDGFDYLGGISHDNPETPETYTGYCNNWWTRSNSLVKRSIVMDDYVYSVALNSIRVAHVDALNKPVTQIDLIK